MENAEERKKMKKIEKEEQLKKKLEQTMEEKMAADSKTVEGESAVVKAEEGNTATEQEAAPALSEEELNAMYERFQQRLQKEGLADAEGNPTEKTLEIRRQIVEKKVEREKQAERQKKIAKRAKTTKHWVQTAKAAGVVLVVGACVFGASMTSEANRIRLVETISGVRNSGDTTWVDNGEDRKYTAEDWDKVKEEIRDKLHIAVPEFYYICLLYTSRKRQISLVLTGVLFLTGIGWQILVEQTSWLEWLLSLLPGAGFLTLSYISREQVGYGDGLLLLTVGIWLGFGQTFGVLTLGLILCSVLCGVLLMRKKIRKQDSIPLVPFLLLGFVGRCGML